MTSVDQNVVEAARIVEGHDNELATSLEHKFEEIARKLFPELDWENTPLQFRVSDGEHVNACIFSFEKPPVIVINRGLLEFIENEDELAFVIGHEMGHNKIRSKLGYTIGDNVTKTEEGGADIISILRCVKAGYNYHAGIDFFTRIDKKIKETNKETVLGQVEAVFDPHPITGNRIVAMELALANENLFKSGTVRDVPYTPLSGSLGDRDSFSQLSHQSFLDSFLPSDYETLPPADKIEWLRKALETTIKEGRFTNDTYTKPLTRGEHILGALSKIKATPEDNKARMESEKIIELIQEVDPYNDKGKFDPFYRIAASVLVPDEQSFLPELGPFTGFGRAVDDFLNAHPNRREEASSALILHLNAISPYLAPDNNKLGGMYKFDSSIQCNSNVIRRTNAFSKLEQKSLWSLYQDAKSYPVFAEAIWRLGGAFDPVYWDVIGEEQLRRFRSISPDLGYRRSSNADERNKEFYQIQQDINEKLLEKSRKVAKEDATSFLSDPEAFLFAHAQELFPKGNPNRPRDNKPIFGSIRGDMSKTISDLFDTFSLDEDWSAPANEKQINLLSKLEGLSNTKGKLSEEVKDVHLSPSKQISDEIIDALQSDDNDRVDQALLAITTLFTSNRTKTVRQWLLGNGQEDCHQRPRDFIKRSKKAVAKAAEKPNLHLFTSFNSSTDTFDPYALEPDHPFIQILMAAGPHLEPTKFLSMLSDVADFRKIEESELLQALRLDKPETVEDAFTLRANLRNQLDKYERGQDIINHITERSIERIIELDTKLSLESDNLLALSRLHKQNKEYTKADSLGPDTVEIIHNSLWSNFSAQRFNEYAEQLDIEQLLDIYQFVESYNLFPDRETQTLLVDAVKSKISDIPISERGPALERLLLDQRAQSKYQSGTYTVKDIGLRDFAAQAYAEHLKARFGQDTGERSYAASIKPIIDEIMKRSLPRDRTLILEKISVALNIQAELAAHIHHKLEPTKNDVLQNHMPIMGVEALMLKIESDEKLRKAVITYLSDPVSRDSVDTLSNIILNDEDLIKKLTNLDFVEVVDDKVALDKLGSDRLNQTLTDLHDNFTSLPVDQKSGILSVLLIPGEHRLDEDKKRATYDDAIQMVFKKVFKPGMENVEEAESFARAYLETAKDFERPAILAALMALSANNDTDSKSVAEQAAQIMCLLGPAYVKLGQAINSHPRTPEDWKAATAELKSNSNIEPRWETIRRTLELLPPEQSGSIIHFGPVLGSASFNTALKLTVNASSGPENVVALIERPHAWTRAENGFNHLTKTINRWDHPIAEQSGETITEMIYEAKDMAQVETNSSIGDRQYDLAQEMYSGTEIIFKKDNTRIEVTPVSSYTAADQIRLISMAEGEHFSDLPETTATEFELKRKVAKAYMALELSNILSGKGFDCDRHGKQMKVDVSDPQNIKVKLYDFGGLNVEEPSKEAKKTLGRVLNDIAKGLQKGQDPITLFETSLEGVEDHEIRNYLMRTRKAWLALQDFQKYVEPNEMLGVLRVAISQSVDKDILSEFKAAKMLKTLQFGGLEFTIKRTNSEEDQVPQFLPAGNGVKDQFEFFGQRDHGERPPIVENKSESSQIFGKENISNNFECS